MAIGKRESLQFNLDDEDVKLFTDEAEEQIELLDTRLVQLESEANPELLQQIFRAAHTLKGSSATIGHKKMASLTHAMESVLDAVRQGRTQPSRTMVDTLLAALDALRILCEEVTTRVDSGIDTAHLEADLLAIVETDTTDGTNPVAAATSGPLAEDHRRVALVELEQGANLYMLEVTVDAECQLPSIRSYQALQELDALGRVLISWPDRTTIESGEGEYEVRALLATGASEEQIQAALTSISDVAGVLLRPMSESDLQGAAPGSAPRPVAAATRPVLAVVEPSVVSEQGRQPNRRTAQSVRIDVERLDGLMNLVGELVIDRTRLQQIREQLTTVLRDTGLSDLMENLEETTAHLARITDELQEEIMRSRMLPIRSVLTRLPRLVRDVAAKCGKQVELITAGEETELDRSVIEELSDPLVHILRNAIDHGIESPDERRAAGKPASGTVRVTAWNQETYIYLSVTDDGKGIDTITVRKKAIERGLVSRETADAASDQQVLQYIFLAGLSTAEKISDVSGRGVGMDIVRTNIERLGGNVSLTSTPGKGSQFIIQLPLTLATTKALMVVANETVYAMPLVSVTEALSEAQADVQSVGGRRTLRLRGQVLPLMELATALDDHHPPRIGTPRYIVAARHGDRQVAFLVDQLLGEQDVVVKTLGDMIGNRRGLTGATILGDGTLGLIIDIASLIDAQTPRSVPA